MDLSQVLSFWFGELGADGRADAAHIESWWRKDPAFDAEISQRFSSTWQRLANSNAAPPKTAEETLAQVIVLDQFSRNMFRNEARAFSADAKALSLVRAAIDHGQDRLLHGHQRVFLYMPFMHSERLEEQELCVSLFTRYRDETQGPFRAELDENVRFAERHRDIIARFARFPHRNQALERTSTPEEIAFLAQPGSSF